MAEVLQAYGKRLMAARPAAGTDLVWVEKEALPWLPASLELALMGASVPFLLDYDDAVFHQYDQHRFIWVRRLLQSKHPTLMQRAACVIAGNAYIASFARDAGARRVEVVPTVVDLERYPVRQRRATQVKQPVHVGWIGQRSTASFLYALTPLFERLSRQEKVRFTAIGINASDLGLPMASVPWSEKTEVENIASFDIGLMPLADGPFERGKCGYKLIQYMACGLPVIASPVGVNRELVKHGVNGFLADSLKEWGVALNELCSDPALRARLGAAGRRMVEQRYSLQAMGPRLAEVLTGAVTPKLGGGFRHADR
jgi:glycosyltransferase involved in cell wall biosynthesis